LRKVRENKAIGNETFILPGAGQTDRKAIRDIFSHIKLYPLSRFPQGGKAAPAPSPLGEGWDGGKNYKMKMGKVIR
jgi:hypothetical protein